MGTLQGTQAVALWQAWGLLEQREGHAEQARILYQQGLEATPYNRFLLLAYGQLEKELGNIGHARILLKFGLKNNPLDPALIQVSPKPGDGHLDKCAAALGPTLNPDAAWQAAACACKIRCVIYHCSNWLLADHRVLLTC